MNFILSNIPFQKAKKVQNVFVKADYILRKSYLLICKGIFYPEDSINSEKLLENIIKYGIEYIYSLKSYICGIFYDLKENLIYLFSDKIGYFNLYYSYNKNFLCISDSFNEILKNFKFNLDDIDIDSIYEFIIFEFPLFENTFIRKIKTLPMGTLFKIDLNEKNLQKKQYFDYVFRINQNLTFEKAIEKLNSLFEKSIERIIRINKKTTTYGLGLSGGMDSRLIAYYLIKNRIKLKTFIFGEKESDAYYIANKLRKLLRLDHYELGYNKNFFKECDKSINFNPMINTQYVWYFSVHKKLPKFDVLLTGYNGDNQFGSHLDYNDLLIKDEEDFVKKIFHKYYELGDIKTILKFFYDESIYLKIKNKIIEFTKLSSNFEYWQKKEEFNYKYRQRIYIKNNPSFNFLGLFNPITIFIDPDLIEFLLTIPFEFRLNRDLFFKFLKEKIPSLLKIRPERSLPTYFQDSLILKIFSIIKYIDLRLKTNFFFKKSHKEIWNWLSGNKNFSSYLKKVFSIENWLFYEIIKKKKLIDLIKKQKWDKFEIQLIFRFLTIKLFLDKFKVNY